MKLKQKLCDPFGGLKTETANELEKIADEYAIEFAEWVDEISLAPYGSLDFSLYVNNDMKQLLEIFKKEKGL